MESVSIVQLPARRIVGQVVISPMEPNLCPTAWQKFEPRISEIDIQGDCLAAVRWDYPGLPEGHFAYIASFESEMEPPSGLETWDLPAARYAEVKVPNLESIRPTIGEFYDTWLPNSEYESGSAPYLELYPEEFPNPPELVLYFALKD